jgi:hypothetical protein
MSTVVPIVGWGPVQLGNSVSVLFTNPGASKGVINRAVFTNVTGTPQSITVYVVRSGGGPTAANTVISAYNIQPGEAYVSPELSSLVLGGGDTVQALSSAAASITTVASGFSV